jgi:hypothetical protein
VNAPFRHERNTAFCCRTLLYLPVVYAKNAHTLEDVGKLAPEAGYLLTIVFPSLTLEQTEMVTPENTNRM